MLLERIVVVLLEGCAAGKVHAPFIMLVYRNTEFLYEVYISLSFCLMFFLQDVCIYAIYIRKCLSC